MALIFNEITESDKKEVLILLKENMEKLFIENFGGFSDEVSAKQVDKITKKGFSYISKINGNLVGYAFFYEEMDFKDSYILNDIQIKKEFQQKGFGSEILKFVENKIKELNGTRIKLLVFENNPALKFYKKHNYEQIDFLEKSKTIVMVKEL